MVEKGSKRVELEGGNDKKQITVVFAGGLIEDFLPIQLVYEGTTFKCHPSGVEFFADWLIHVSATFNHWCNERLCSFTSPRSLHIKEEGNGVLLHW